MILTNERIEGLDPEWLALILEAKELGISRDAIHSFFSQCGTKESCLEQGEVHNQ